MVTTRRTLSAPEVSTSPPITSGISAPIVSETMQVSIGNTQPLGTDPPISENPVGTDPPLIETSVEGTQSQGPNSSSLQMVLAPLGTAPPTGAYISTITLPASTNPRYGLPNYPSRDAGGSGHANPMHEPYQPNYVPNPRTRYEDFEGPYSDSSTDEERAPRRQRPSKEPVGQRTRINDGPPLTALERIKAHEAEIA